MFSLQRVSFSYPGSERVIFNELSLSVPKAKVGFVGPNGFGKTTLAKILTAELAAQKGLVTRQDLFKYFEQFEAAPDQTVAEHLSEFWNLAADEQHRYQVLLGSIEWDKSCRRLSGGQWMRVRLAKAFSSHRYWILDEPTNHLDQRSRTIMAEFLQQQDCFILISHDREVLSVCSYIVEFSSLGVEGYGMGFEDYLEQSKVERQSKLDQLRESKRKFENQIENRQEQLDKQDKRMRKGKEEAAKGGMPRILVGALKRKAQVTMAKVKQTQDRSLEFDKAKVSDLYERIKSQESLRLPTPQLSLPRGKLVLDIQAFNLRMGEHWLWKRDLTAQVFGPQKILLRGSNGSGKSSLIKALAGYELGEVSRRGQISRGEVSVFFLQQNDPRLESSLSVIDWLQQWVERSETELRNLLADFLFVRDQVFQKVGSLSGGEKMRLLLALLNLMPEPAQFLVLDEPANNLDLSSKEMLKNYLEDYSGAILIVSHEEWIVSDPDLIIDLDHS